MNDAASAPATVDLRVLADLFPTSAIEWRIQSAYRRPAEHPPFGCRVVPYIDVRCVADRLDAVVGPGNWRNEFAKGPDGGVLCGLSIYFPDRREWVTKWDGAEGGDFERVKGGLTNAMKRAAVHWGIGRYLHQISAAYGVVSDAGRYLFRGEIGPRHKREEVEFRWDPPPLPAWAIPEGERQASAPAASPPPRKSSRAESQEDPRAAAPWAEFDRRLRACGDRESIQRLYAEFKEKHPEQAQEANRRVNERLRRLAAGDAPDPKRGTDDVRGSRPRKEKDRSDGK